MAKSKNLFLYLALILIIFLNLGLIYLSWEPEKEIEEDPLKETRLQGEFLFAFWEDWLAERDYLEENGNRILAQGKWELERSDDEAEIKEILHQYASRIQDLVARENHYREINRVIDYIEREFNFVTEQGHVLIFQENSGETKLIEGSGTVSFPENVGKNLSYLDTMGPIEVVWNEDLVEIYSASQFNKFIEEKEQIIGNRDKIIQEKDRIIADWQRRWQQLARISGYEIMEGPGIVVRVFDVQGGFRNDQIVHDTDIRRIVNELFAAGAEGLEVGGERLIATSAIRCGGPVILVNQRPVPVDPVVIKAIGSPEVLSSALHIVRNELAVFGVKVEIEVQESVTLGKKDG